MSSRSGLGAHLGINVYVWREGAQDRVLVECISPIVNDLLCGGLCQTFWFDRYDARGPHLLLVLGVRGENRSAATSLLSSGLDAYLESQPSMDVMPPNEMAFRHEGCRSKPLCDVDAEEGFARNNTYRIFEHKASFYPFPLLLSVSASDQLWMYWCNISLWPLECIAKRQAWPAAVQWVAMVARALKMSGGAEPYWRYHMQRLAPELSQRLETVGAQAVSIELRRSIEAVGGGVLFTTFHEQAAFAEIMPDIDELVQVVVESSGCVAKPAWQLLYALTHTTLKQLGLGVRYHVPLISAAWLLSYDPCE